MTSVSPSEDEFRRVAGWCRSHLAMRGMPEVAASLGSLLESFGELSAASEDRASDRFDDLKTLEARVDALLADFAATCGESLGPAGREAGTPGAQSTSLFVYGTLKRGYSRSGALRGQTFLGEAVTAPRYRMFDCGSYPGLVECEGGVAVAGEVWEVDAACLAALDEIEGVHLRLYRRGAVLLGPPYSGMACDAYFYARGTTGLHDCGTRW